MLRPQTERNKCHEVVSISVFGQWYQSRFYDPNLGRFLSADTIVPGSGALTMTGGGNGGGPADPQQLNRYAYVRNNPIKNTDPSGHCIPGIGDCQFTGQLNWQDGAAFASGVADGVVNTIVGVATTPVAIAQAIADPSAAVAGLQQQADTVVRGAQFAVRDPSGAAAALNDDPHAVGEVMGTALATAALAKIGGGEGGCNSFRAETPVATPTGKQPIASLDVGDTVYAFNEMTGTTGVYTITATISHVDSVIVPLRLENEWIETTPEHPFYALLRGWVDAEDLAIGDSVRRYDGTYGTVQDGWLESTTQQMYNLTVADAHTFFVGDGGWLVHNIDCRLPNGDAGKIVGNLERYAGSDGLLAKGNKIREVDGLVSQYGGPRADWRKLKGIDSIELPSGDIRTGEIHWYQNGNRIVKPKVKEWVDYR